VNNTNAPPRAQGRSGVIRLVLAFVLAAGLILATLWANGQIQLGNPLKNSAGAFFNVGAGTCDISYYALDPNDPTKSNPDKEVPYAVGTPVTQRDEAGIKAELEERRECGSNDTFDPELTSTHYADWSASGLTKIEVAYSEIDAFTAKIAADPELYAQVVTELETLENASAFSVEDVPAGLWSVYVVPNGNGGLTTHVGRTSNPGQVAAFAHPSGAVIKYRLNCGFQILHETPPPGLPECVGNDCEPECPPDKPYGPYPLCKDSPDNDPEAQDNNLPGGGGLAPPVDEDASDPDVPKPGPVYTPAPTPTPTATPDPAPAPSPEATQPPAVGCAPAPGKPCP
jgi:hypothetical protein